jgi:hypothetical protein
VTKPLARASSGDRAGSVSMPVLRIRLRLPLTAPLLVLSSTRAGSMGGRFIAILLWRRWADWKRLQGIVRHSDRIE